METDIELALTRIESRCHEMLVEGVPDNYFLEDRCQQGYGLVLRSNLSRSDDELNEKIYKFLEPILPLVSLLQDSGCILRIGVFNKSLTTTLFLSFTVIEALGCLNASIEISVYPVDESVE